MNLTEVKDVAVIGAGEAGLAAAKMLLSVGCRCTVFERSDRIGGVWAIGYAGYAVQVQRELYEIPDWPLPLDAPDFTPGEQIQAYLQSYADHFGVTPHVRLETEVVRIEPREHGKPGWSVTVRDASGSEQRSDFDLVVVAVGIYSHTPNMPQFPGQQQFGGEILHSSQIQSATQLAGRRVVVVGYGKSATDIAILAAEQAKHATIVFREPHWPVPAVLVGGLPFKYAMFNRLTNAMLPLYVRPLPAEQRLHDLAEPVIGGFWRVVEQLLVYQCGLDRPRRGKSATRADLMPSDPIEYDGFGNATMLPKPAFFDSIHSGKLDAQRAEIESYTETGVILSNGERLDCDVVVLGTGWKTDYGFLSEMLRERIGFEDDGYYLYRQILHPDVPNLAFIGANAATYCNILTHNLQARWLAELVRGRHRLPSDAPMRADIEQEKAWKRKIIPPASCRAAILHLHMQHYHDELLSDMGVSPWRKRGAGPLRWASELLAPYEPRDYAGVSSGADL